MRKPLILAFIALVAVAIVVAALWNRIRTDGLTIPPVGVNSSEKVYQDALVGFRFEYPGKYQILDSNQRSGSIGDEAGYVVIRIDVNEEQGSLEEWLGKNIASAADSERITIPITIGGIPGLRIVEHEYDSGVGYEVVTIYHGFVVRIRYRGLMQSESARLEESFVFTER